MTSPQRAESGGAVSESPWKLLGKFLEFSGFFGCRSISVETCVDWQSHTRGVRGLPAIVVGPSSAGVELSTGRARNFRGNDASRISSPSRTGEGLVTRLPPKY